MPSADFHYACDRRWWEMYYDEVKEKFTGKSYTIKDADNESLNLPSEYDVIRVASQFGKGLNKHCLHYGHAGGGNSGFQALNLAYLLGADVVFLLGFNMGGKHFFGDHPPPLKVDSPFREFVKTFETVDQTKIQVINCTQNSALNCFPKMSLESALSSVQGRA